MSALQLDLFGDVEAAEEVAATAAAAEAASKAEAELRQAERLAAWQARFEIGVYRLVHRKRLGEWRIGYRCPDPWCATIDNPRDLTAGHGFDPTRPGWAPSDGRCFGVRRLERTTHRLEDIEVTPQGHYIARCWCRAARFSALSRADLTEQAREHKHYVTQVKPPIEEWSSWADGWYERWKS
jgi:hypothetical protein